MHRLKNNGAITITNYTGPGGLVILPSVINGLPVVSIGENAFFYFPKLTSVTIPASVTSIGPRSFAFTGLTALAIPGSVTNIGYEAFYECENLRMLTLGDGVTSIGDGAFCACGLTNVSIPGSVAKIGNNAFNDDFFVTSL